MSGQITRGMPLGDAIYALSRHSDYKVFLDIGTFHGTGTTKILVDSLQNNTICKVYSVEANGQLYNSATKYHTPKPVCLTLLWGKLSNTMMSLSDIMKHPSFNDVKPHFDIHYKQDCIDFARAPLVDLPGYVDVVIADGGEFCGIGDMERYLQLMPKVIVLDDVNVMKNCDVKTHLLANGWTIQEQGADRNGWCILVRKATTPPNYVCPEDKYWENFEKYCESIDKILKPESSY
jgi:hypothetical protein